MMLLAIGLVGVAATIVRLLDADEPLTHEERQFLVASLVFVIGCVLLTLAALAWLP